MANPGYQAHPMNAQSPLSFDEVKVLLEEDGRSVLKNRTSLIHLLRRVWVTLSAHQEQTRSLNSTIQSLRDDQAGSGFATTLDPRDAVKFLSPDQLAALVEGHLRERVEVASRMVQEAKQIQLQVNREVAATRFAVSGIEEDPSVPPDVKDRFRRLRDRLPQERELDVPGAFDPITPEPGKPGLDGLFS
jgi:hypothetical protein